MATTFKPVYSSSASLTITLNSLAGTSSGVGRESIVVDNTSTLYDDVLIQPTFCMAGTAPANDQAIYIYAAGGNATCCLTYPATGTDAAITIQTAGSPIKLISVIPYVTTLTSGVLIEGSPFSLANAFGGNVPPYWSLAVVNFSGSVAAAQSNNITYVGVQYQGV